MPKRLTHVEMMRERFKIVDYVESDKIYHQYPIKVTRRFREGLIRAFPSLQQHPRARAYRAMLEYLLYATLRDEEGRLVFPAETLASLVGAKVGTNGFAALDYLQGFSDDVFPLVISDYIPHKRARCVSFELPEAIADLSSANDLLAADADKVWLVSGIPVSPTSRRSAAARYEEDITFLLDGVNQDHPAYDLMQYLNNQSQVALGKRILANWHRLVAMHDDMEPGERKNSAGFVLLTLEDWRKNLYGTSERTSRISTRGITIHSLPRAMRKAALSGGVEMDIRSSQAAIVSRLWDLPEMGKILASGTSFWSVMLEHLALNENAKSALKTALYAACFGMGKRKLLTNLAAEIGKEKATAFFSHPVMVEVLDGRAAAMKRVKAAGGVEDAFGKWIVLSREMPAHAALAIEAQSWELRLMLPIFDTVKGVRNLSILSWLHDGVVVYHNETGRLTRLLVRAKSAFDEHAVSLGFATDLEIVQL